MADELNSVVGQLAPKHLRAIREGLSMSRQISLARKISLRDPLRMNQVDLSPRVLWLARVVATEVSLEQIDKHLLEGSAELLRPGMGDMRELVRTVGQKKTIRFEDLRGSRPFLPIGGWASNIKLGAIRANVADEVLRDPAEWPGDLVQRAVEEIEVRISAGARSIAALAASDNWFQESSNVAAVPDLAAEGFQRSEVVAKPLNVEHTDPLGLGPFGRLTVTTSAPLQPGVYAWVIDCEVRYVGMTGGLLHVVQGARMQRSYND
nr:hypothetical protein [Micromonospora sp. DSM 115978]